MKDYLAGYEELAKLVDALIAQKYPGEEISKHKSLRKKSIEELDEAIDIAIFSSLSKPELDRLNQLLDDESTTEEDYNNFFKDAKVDLAKITEQTVSAYAEQFLEKREGGKNA